MTDYVIFQNPDEASNVRGKPQRSAPIPVSDVKAHAILQKAGWFVAEELTHEEALSRKLIDPPIRMGLAKSVTVQLDPTNLPRIAQELNALVAGKGVRFEVAPPAAAEPFQAEAAPVAGFAWADAGLKQEQWDALTEAGYGTEDALNAATDAQLGEVKGVGEASIRNLRKHLKPQG